MSVLNNSNAIESGGYNIDRSLRFRSSASAYLSKTFSGAPSTFTWSCWLKRGALGSQQMIAASRYVSATSASIVFNSSDQIYFACNGTILATSTAVFRDPSAWYHIVVKATVSGNVTIYVNNSSVATGTAGASNWLFTNAANYVNTIGEFGDANNSYFDGYLAEVNFIDGQALTPSSFGQTDATTGVWVPKRYVGTYGTNGFYLPFTDNTSPTTLGYDKSGNGNNWTPNNISTTAGATYDSMTDVPTLTSATAANFAVWNPLDRTAATYSEGNLKVVSSSASAPYNMTASIAFPLTGKFYCEVTALVGGSSPLMGLGTNRPSDLISGYRVNGTYINNIAGASTSGTPSTYTTNDIIGIAYDIDAGTLSFYKNGVAQSGGITGIPANGYFLCVRADSASGDGGYLNCGQRPFSYTPPTGFKALNTFNLPDPTIKKPNQYFDAQARSGNDVSPRTVSGYSFAPDLVWIKNRSGAYDHALHDTARGAGKWLGSNRTSAEATNSPGGYLSAFNSDGYALTAGGTNYLDVNSAGQTYVDWCWKKGATPGFDIVTYTGNGSSTQTVAHSLGVAPKMIIGKNRGRAADWPVYHASLAANNNLFLDLTNATAASPSFGWIGSASSTNFTLNMGATNGFQSNQLNDTFVAYLFAEIAGFSKFGSYTGNGSADGPFVYCGFRPKYVLVKDTTNAGTNWMVLDTSRDQYNVEQNYLSPNASSAEGAATAWDGLSNGFKLRGAGTPWNGSGATMIFAAFAENPFKYSNAR